MRRRLAVEPLDNARWQRIEDGLVARLEREPVQIETAPRARFAWPYWLAAAAVFAVVVAFFFQSTRAAPRVASAPVTTVETQASSSRIELATSSLEVAAHSSARIEGDDSKGIVVSLEYGAVECEVAPREARPPFVVRAGELTVRVVGTHFRVERVGGATRVSVERGTVEVTSGAETAIVQAGSSWPLPAKTAIEREAPVPTVVTTTTAAAKPSTTVATAPTTAPTTTATPRERYDRAIAIESSHPDEALAIYRELAAGDGTWAMNALFAEGRFQLERGNKDVARARFEEYVKKYPTGPNAHDARELLAKLP